MSNVWIGTFSGTRGRNRRPVLARPLTDKYTTAAGPRQRLDQVRAFLAALPAQQYPDLAAVAGEFLAGQFTARFELGLSAILDRLAAERAA